MDIRPHFIKGAEADLFLIHYSTGQSKSYGQVLLIPPLFEEMNKSRRFLALLAKKLVLQGYEVVLADLTGTGDSGGDIDFASWSIWLQDLDTVYQWMQKNYQNTSLNIFSMRAGCLLMTDWIRSSTPGVHTVIYLNPCSDGEVYLKQFLRMRVMSSRIEGKNETVKELREELNQGRNVEVGGYAISQKLASGISLSGLMKHECPEFSNIKIIQIGRESLREPPPGIKKIAQKWQINLSESFIPIQAEQFWATQEIFSPVNVVDCVGTIFKSDQIARVPNE